MNFKVFIFIAFATFVACDHHLRASPPTFPEGEAVKCIEEFYNGYFAHFDLPSPTQIIKCYSPRDAAIFFTSIYEFYKILEDLEKRDQWDLHIRLIKEYFLAMLQSKVSRCIGKTQDIRDLLKALGIKASDMKKFAYGQYLYVQAHYSKMRGEYKPIIENILSKNFTAAGEANGVLAKNIVDTINEEKFGYLYIAAFENGFAMRAGVSNPNDSLSVWNHTTGGVAMMFLHELSEAVSRGKWAHSFRNTIKFMKGRGKDLLKEIPGSVFECLEGSEDNKELTEKLGVNVLSKEFGKKMGKFIWRHPLKYHMYLTKIKHAMEHLQLGGAGAYYASLVMSAAKNRRMEEIEIETVTF